MSDETSKKVVKNITSFVREIHTDSHVHSIPRQNVPY